MVARGNGSCAVLFGLLNSPLRSLVTGEMAHASVAIVDARRRRFVDDRYVRLWVDAPLSHHVDVAGRLTRAVAVHAAQVRQHE